MVAFVLEQTTLARQVSWHFGHMQVLDQKSHEPSALLKMSTLFKAVTHLPCVRKFRGVVCEHEQLCRRVDTANWQTKETCKALVVVDCGC